MSDCLRKYVTCDADVGGPETWCDNCRKRLEPATAAPLPEALTLNPRQPISDEESKALLQTMDGAKWANAFCRVTGFSDEGWALAWFCNAIMATYDPLKNRLDTALSALAAAQQERDEAKAEAQDWESATAAPLPNEQQEGLVRIAELLKTGGMTDAFFLAGQVKGLIEALATAQQERDEARQKSGEYHRRAQQAEAAIVATVTDGQSIGRALANAGYRHWQERAEAAEAERDALKAERDALAHLQLETADKLEAMRVWVESQITH
jgi:hypothetical protein